MPYFLALTILLAPTYVARFKLLGLPTNLLMVWLVAFWIIFAAYLSYKKNWHSLFFSIFSLDKKLLAGITIFFLAGALSLFVGDFSQAKLGQFIVLFLQPISLFFIGRFIIQKNSKTKSLLLAASYLLLAILGAYAVLQYFTLIGLTPEYWGNNVEPKRALSFFSHPNFYSLFITPLLAFLLPNLIRRINSFISSLSRNRLSVQTSTDKGSLGFARDDKMNIFFIIGWLLGVAGLFFSLSRAGWLGLLTAIVVYLIVAADKKTRLAFFGLMIIGIVAVFSITNLRYRIILPLLGEKSAVSRVSLWQTGWKGIQESPILGMGLTGFSQNWNRLNTDPNIDSHNYPHNVFLNFWVETGLLGLISFIIIVGVYIYHSLRPNPPLLARRGDGGEVETSADDKTIHLGITLFLIALITQGLIDNPYFKNDLALIFWIILWFI